MRVGLIDCDNKNSVHPFPNLSLMKLSAWHKRNGDLVEWYDPLLGGHYDRVYVSKVFSFTPDYEYFINADEIIKGGSGFAITVVDGKEIYDKSKDKPLNEDIEHIFPDYSIYGITDTAYGFISRGCPRKCDFCHVKDMQGIKAHRVARLSEFWDGQKNIVLLDPNISACVEWKEIFQELIESKSYVDFSQGLDIRLMTDEKIELLKKIKIRQVHFAWDRLEDEPHILPRMKRLVEITGWDRHKVTVYVLVGDRERRVTEGDLHRIYELRKLGVQPYVMIYDKEHLPKGHELKRLQRWVNNKFIWMKTERFEDYGNV